MTICKNLLFTGPQNSVYSQPAWSAFAGISANASLKTIVTNLKLVLNKFYLFTSLKLIWLKSNLSKNVNFKKITSNSRTTEAPNSNVAQIFQIFRRHRLPERRILGFQRRRLFDRQLRIERLLCCQLGQLFERWKRRLFGRQLRQLLGISTRRLQWKPS